MCLAEGGNHLHRRDWRTPAENCSGAGPLKVDTSPVPSLGEGIGPALLSVLVFARGLKGTGKLSPVPSHSITLLVLWCLQGAVEEGLGLSSVIVIALIRSGMPHSVSIGSRSCHEQPLAGSAWALPLGSTLFCTNEICIPFQTPCT